MLATVAPLVPVMATARTADRDIGVVQSPCRSGLLTRPGPRRQIPRSRSGYRDDEGDAIHPVPEGADAVVLGKARGRGRKVVDDDAPGGDERPEHVRLERCLDQHLPVVEIPEEQEQTEHLRIGHEGGKSRRWGRGSSTG